MCLNFIVHHPKVPIAGIGLCLKYLLTVNPLRIFIVGFCFNGHDIFWLFHRFQHSLSCWENVGHRGCFHHDPGDFVPLSTGWKSQQFLVLEGIPNCCSKMASSACHKQSSNTLATPGQKKPTVRQGKTGKKAMNLVPFGGKVQVATNCVMWIVTSLFVVESGYRFLSVTPRSPSNLLGTVNTRRPTNIPVTEYMYS